MQGSFFKNKRLRETKEALETEKKLIYILMLVQSISISMDWFFKNRTCARMQPPMTDLFTIVDLRPNPHLSEYLHVLAVMLVSKFESNWGYMLSLKNNSLCFKKKIDKRNSNNVSHTIVKFCFHNITQKKENVYTNSRKRDKWTT
jgi:hypothetical protein